MSGSHGSPPPGLEESLLQNYGFGSSALVSGPPALPAVVCDVDGSAGGGNSVLVDTPAVPLSAQGDAQFSGKVGPLPAGCSSEPDIAFVLRIVQPVAFADRWIAAGAVRIP